MPVWGVWLDGRLWFSSGLRSRKARNLAADPRCTLTTDDARDPVVVEGTAERVTDAERDRRLRRRGEREVRRRHDRGVPGPGGQRHLRRPAGAGLRAHPRRLHRQPHPVDVQSVRSAQPDSSGSSGRKVTDQRVPSGVTHGVARVRRRGGGQQRLRLVAGRRHAGDVRQPARGLAGQRRTRARPRRAGASPSCGSIQGVTTAAIAVGAYGAESPASAGGRSAVARKSLSFARAACCCSA